ncbi:MAG: hypothetical protein ACI9XU_001704 [Arenicella sp.]|jgi:hypothetical protein
MNALISQTRNTLMSLFLCLALVISNIANAQVDLSPKGRIDIQNDQTEDKLNSKKDLIFKNSGPLRDVVVGSTYISGAQICEVEISTSYFQAASLAIVEAEIDHADCAASNGKYTVSLKFQDAVGEIHSTKYKEVWSRTEAQAIMVKHSYQIGDNMDLLRARIKLPPKDYCSCLDG